MAESEAVHIGENSPEEVAFKLLKIIANCESMNMPPYIGGNKTAPDRNWVLDTYAECLKAATGKRAPALPKVG